MGLHFNQGLTQGMRVQMRLRVHRMTSQAPRSGWPLPSAMAALAFWP